MRPIRCYLEPKKKRIGLGGGYARLWVRTKARLLALGSRSKETTTVDNFKYKTATSRLDFAKEGAS